MDTDMKTFKLKICLVGEEGVGKTSLVHRFVSGAFDESYIRTLGAGGSKKSVTLGSVRGRAPAPSRARRGGGRLGQPDPGLGVLDDVEDPVFEAGGDRSLPHDERII